MTLEAEFGHIAGLRVALVGDVVDSRVARSNVLGLLAIGADVTLVGPPTLLPAAMARAGVRVERDLDAVLPELDALMLLRIQQERIASAVLPSLDDYARQLSARRAAARGAAAGRDRHASGPVQPRRRVRRGRLRVRGLALRAAGRLGRLRPHGGARCSYKRIGLSSSRLRGRTAESRKRAISAVASHTKNTNRLYVCFGLVNLFVQKKRMLRVSTL